MNVIFSNPSPPFDNVHFFLEGEALPKTYSTTLLQYLNLHEKISVLKICLSAWFLLASFDSLDFRRANFHLRSNILILIFQILHFARGGEM